MTRNYQNLTKRAFQIRCVKRNWPKLLMIFIKNITKKYSLAQYATNLQMFHTRNCWLFNSFQKKMYPILKTPDGSGWAKKLHPTLAKQYDVSEFFPKHLEVKNILLSPNGVVRHVQSCVSGENCQCIPKMYFCNQTRSSCLQRLQMGKLPKFSIANGN